MSLRRFEQRLVLAALLIAGCGIASPGEGEKVGQIVRVNQHGFICKTWEAQIMRGGFNNGTGASGAAFDFTVANEAEAETLRGYMESQTEVVLKYRTHGPFYSICSSESGGDFLVSVKPSRRAS